MPRLTRKGDAFFKFDTLTSDLETFDESCWYYGTSKAEMLRVMIRDWNEAWLLRKKEESLDVPPEEERRKIRGPRNRQAEDLKPETWDPAEVYDKRVFWCGVTGCNNESAYWIRSKALRPASMYLCKGCVGKLHPDLRPKA